MRFQPSPSQIPEVIPQIQLVTIVISKKLLQHHCFGNKNGAPFSSTNTILLLDQSLWSDFFPEKGSYTTDNSSKRFICRPQKGVYSLLFFSLHKPSRNISEHMQYSSFIKLPNANLCTKFGSALTHFFPVAVAVHILTIFLYWLCESSTIFLLLKRDCWSMWKRQIL